MMRLFAFAEQPAHYHVDLYRQLAGALGDRFQALYGSAGQAASEGVVYSSWGGEALRNNTGLLEGYPNLVVPRLGDTQTVRRFLRAELRLGAGDVVLAHTFLPAFSRTWLLAAKSLGANIVYRGSSYLPPYSSPLKNLARRARDGFAFAGFDAFCATGTVTWRYYEQNAWRKPIHFSPYCLDERVFTPYVRDRERLREEERQALGIAPGDVLVAFLGRFVLEKNLFRLLEGLHRASSVHLPLVLAGGGPLERELQAFVKQRSWRREPRFLGLLDRHRVARLLCAADVVAMPSVYETWGVTVNEALRLGNTVLVSPAVGSAQDLVVDGVNGAMIDPFDPDSIADGLLRCEAIHREGRGAELTAQLNRIFTSERAARGVLAAARGSSEPSELPPGLRLTRSQAT